MSLIKRLGDSGKCLLTSGVIATGVFLGGSIMYDIAQHIQDQEMVNYSLKGLSYLSAGLSIGTGVIGTVGTVRELYRRK